MKQSTKGIAVFSHPMIGLAAILVMLFSTAVSLRAGVRDDSYRLTFSKDGRLSLNSQGAPLEKILAHIQSETKCSYRLSREHLDKAIYASFRSLSVHEAIKRILHGISYACIMDPNGQVSRIITFSNSGAPLQDPSDHQETSKRFSSGAEPMLKQEISADTDAASHLPQPPNDVREALEETMEPVPPPFVAVPEEE